MGEVVYLRIEGCNFGRTIEDTDDLSTIRGASLAYIDAPGAIVAEVVAAAEGAIAELAVVMQAASFGLFRLNTSLTPAAIEQRVADVLRRAPERSASGDIWRVIPHLTFSWAAIAIGAGAEDYLQATRFLGAEVQRRQFAAPTVVLPVLGSGEPTGYCDVDGVRPLSGVSGRRGRFGRRVSDSVLARQRYGRRKKQDFYRDEVEASGLAELIQNEEKLGFLREDAVFAPSFEDLAAEPPTGLKAQLVNKMAVLYLDGNKFSKVRRAALDLAGTDADKEGIDGAFSGFLRRKRAALLATFLATCNADQRMYRQVRDEEQRNRQMFRFETLLWGGDESMVVFPAWKAFEMLSVLEESIGAGWWFEPPEKHAGPNAAALEGVSHAAGLVIADTATPIRFLKNLAKDLAEEIKKAAAAGEREWQVPSAVQIAVLESVEPPVNGVQAFNRDRYGVADTAAFTIRLDGESARMRAAMETISDPSEGMPRSQLFNILRKAHAIRVAANGGDWAATVGEMLEGYGRERFERAGVADLIEMFQATDNGLGYAPKRPLLPFQRCAELWDYVRPFSEGPISEEVAA